MACGQRDVRAVERSNDGRGDARACGHPPHKIYGEEQCQGRQQAACAACVEASAINRAGPAVLEEKKRRDQIPGEDEEDRNADRAHGVSHSLGVRHDHEQDSETPESIKHRDVCESGPLVLHRASVPARAALRVQIRNGMADCCGMQFENRPFG